MALDISAKKVYGALKKDVSAIDSKVDNAILSIYKAGGSLEFDDLPSPSSDVANMAYIVTDAFTTTSDFVEGAGVDYPAGTYVAIVNTGTEDDPDYKYDVVPFTMVVDDTMSAVSENPLQNKVITGAVQEIRLDISNLSASKISKSETVGHVMNDGSIDENEYAEKVADATSGHLAGLDSNGNLTDSGVSPTEDVTVEGNPVTFDSPFEQDAKSVVVSVKPIQDLHGYDHPWVGGAGKNKLPLVLADIKAANTSGTWSGNAYTHNGITYTILVDNANNVTRFSISGTATNDGSGFDLIKNDALYPFNGTYIISGADGFGNYVAVADIKFTDSSYDTLVYSSDVEKAISSNLTQYGLFIWPGITINKTIYPMIRLATESDATFAPYSNECPISGIDEVEIEVSDGESEPTTTTIPLPSTLYDADVDVTNGDADENKALKLLSSTDNWVKSAHPTIPSGRYVYYIDTPLPGCVPCGNDRNVNNVYMESSVFTIDNTSYDSLLDDTDFAIGIGGDNNGSTIGINTDIDNLPDFKDWVDSVGIQILYPLATPTTLSFDPTDVELLEGTNVVSTNGEKVAVTYGRSLWQDIDDLKTDTEGKLDKSDVADVEDDTASRPYSVNEFMLRADGLYKVTQPIAQNASITASNTTKTTVGEVLTALLNA